MRMLPLTLLLSACGGPITGIWMIQYNPSSAGESSCEEDCKENFEDGECPSSGGGGGDSDWEYTSDYTGSDSIFFVQIETSTSGAAVLFLGDGAYPGTFDAGTWNFFWDSATNSEDTEEHEDGYVNSASLVTSAVTTFVLTPTGATGVGTIEGTSSEVYAYTESDEWDPDDNDRDFGEIPAYYLEDDDGDQGTLSNEADEQDCEDDECEIEISRTCDDGAVDFTATKTDFADEDAFDYVRYSGQGGDDGGGIDTGF